MVVKPPKGMHFLLRFILYTIFSKNHSLWVRGQKSNPVNPFESAVIFATLIRHGFSMNGQIL